MPLIVGIIGIANVMYKFVKTGELDTVQLTTFAGLAGFQSIINPPKPTPTPTSPEAKDDDGSKPTAG